MPTTVTKTIGSAGRDYATPELFDDAAGATNLAGLDQVWEGSSYNDSEIVVAGAVVSMDLDTGNDTTHYPIFDTGSGQSFRDNVNVRTNPLYYNATNGVGWRNSGSATATFDGKVVPNCRVRNIQIAGDAGSNSTFRIGAATGTWIIDNCIFVGSETIALSGSATTFNNCLFVNTNGPFNRGIQSDSATYNFCTFICAPSLAFYAYNVPSSTLVFNGCAFFGGGTTAFNVNSGTLTFDHCMTDITGTTGLAGGKTFANQFVSTTNDFRVKTGADLIGAGAPIGGITTDISGFARSGTPTIGCWEFPSGGGGGSALPLIGIGHSLVQVGPGIVPIYAAEALRRNNIMTRRRALSGVGWLKK